MLKEHRSQTLLQFILNFSGQIAFPVKLAETAAAIGNLFDAETWVWPNPHTVVFPEANKKRLTVLTHAVFHVQTIGLDAWTEKLGDYETIAAMVLEKLAPSKLKRVGIKLKVFSNLELTHPEMVDSMFGSFLLPRADLRDVATDFNDVYLRLYGTAEEDKFELQLVPQTQEQVETDIYGWQNIDNFNIKGALAAAAELADLVSRPAFTLECDLFRTDPRKEDVLAILKHGVEKIDTILERATNRLLALPQRK